MCALNTQYTLGTSVVSLVHVVVARLAVLNVRVRFPAVHFFFKIVEHLLKFIGSIKVHVYFISGTHAHALMSYVYRPTAALFSPATIRWSAFLHGPLPSGEVTSAWANGANRGHQLDGMNLNLTPSIDAGHRVGVWVHPDHFCWSFAG